MKYTKKFESATSADNYVINDVPFVTLIDTNRAQILLCNQENKKIVVDGQGNASIVDSKPIVIYHTRVKNADNYNYVEIEFEKGMTWSDFVNNSSYNDESKMTGEESCIGKFSIDSEGYVNAPFMGFGKGNYNVPQKGTDIITPNIEYEVGGHDYKICYE